MPGVYVHAIEGRCSERDVSGANSVIELDLTF
jgi:hypothetical protein